MTRRTNLAARHLLAGAILLVITGMTAHAQTSAQKIEAAEKVFYEAARVQEATYRKALGEAIKDHATRCEVFLLDFMPSSKRSDSFFNEPSDENHFPIRPYKTETKILKRRELNAEEFKALLPSLMQTVGVEKNTYGAFCHMPIHGIRVYDQGILIVETSICYECGNFFISYPDKTAEWVGLSSREFEELMKKFMPIPESEILRFQDLKSGKKIEEKVEQKQSETRRKTVRKKAE